MVGFDPWSNWPMCLWIDLSTLGPGGAGADGPVEMLRIVKLAKDSAIKPTPPFTASPSHGCDGTTAAGLT